MPARKRRPGGGLRKEGKGLEPMAEDFLEEFIVERIAQILHDDLNGTKKFYEEQDAIMESLDQETKDKFEEFASDMICISSKECVAVYKEAFLDGLQLGHRAFR